MNFRDIKGRFPTVEEVRSRYAPKQELEIGGSRFLFRVIRPISFYLTVPALALGISANQVTLGGLAVGVLSVILLATGNRGLTVFGSGLFALALFADFVDGNIARFHKRTSHYGNFLDAFAESTLATLLPIGLALGLALHPDPLMQTFPQAIAVSGVWVLAAIWCSLTALTYQLIFRIRAAKFQIRLQPQTDGQGVSAPPANPVKESLIPSWLPGWVVDGFQRGYRVLEAERSVMHFMLPAFVLADVASLYVALRSVATVLLYLIVVAALIRDARKNLRVRRIRV